MGIFEWKTPKPLVNFQKTVKSKVIVTFSCYSVSTVTPPSIFPTHTCKKKRKVVARLFFFIDKETRFTRNTLLETQHWITTKECKSRSRAKYRFLDASQWYFVHEIQWYAVIKTCNQDSDDDKFLFYLWRMAFQDAVFIILKITNNHPNCTSMEALDAFLPSFHSDRR